MQSPEYGIFWLIHVFFQSALPFDDQLTKCYLTIWTTHVVVSQYFRSLPIPLHSQSVTNIQVGQEFVPWSKTWSNVSLTNIFVKNNGFDQDILVKC